MRSLLLLALAAAASAPLATAASPAPVWFQLHSYNDLRGWPQALAKASARVPALPVLLKLDPQWLPAAACASQTRAAPDARGCLVLNHDTVGASARKDLNTTEDVLAALSSPALAPFAGPGAAADLVISFCFKGCGGGACPCDGATHAPTAAWLSLVDDFLAAAQALVAQRGLRVEFVLDGSGNSGAAACLADRWRPLTSVYISGGDPAGAFTSNNASLGWDRLATLNDNTALFPVAAALDFGKFAAGPRPLVVWEPADQKTMLAMGAAAAAAPAVPAAGLRFAINADVAQAAAYTAPLAGAAAWGGVLVQGTAGAAPAGAAAAAAAVPAAASWAATPWLALAAVAFWPGGGAPLNVSVFGFNSTHGGARALLCSAAAAGGAGGGAPAAGATAHLSVVPLAGADARLAVLVDVHAPGARNTTLLVFSLRGADGGCALAAAPGGGAQPLPAAAALAAAAAVPCAGGAGARPAGLRGICRLFAAHGGPADACAVTVGYGALGAPPTWAGCAVTQPLALDSLSLAAAGYGGGAGGVARVAAALAYTGGGKLYGATACAAAPLAAPAPPAAAAAAGAVFNDPATCFGSAAPPGGSAQPPGTTAPLAAYVGAGARVSLAALPPSAAGAARIAALVTTAGGWCPNNEADNKAAAVGACDAVPGVAAGGGAYLTYHAAALDRWGTQLLGGAGGAAGGASGACSALVATGAFGMGAAPAPALVDLGAGAGAGVHGFVVAEGAAAPSDTHHCGPPLPAPHALVVAAWPLPQGFVAPL
jgi:hypothetical protein